MSCHGLWNSCVAFQTRRIYKHSPTPSTYRRQLSETLPSRWLKATSRQTISWRYDVQRRWRQTGAAVGCAPPGCATASVQYLGVRCILCLSDLALEISRAVYANPTICLSLTFALLGGGGVWTPPPPLRFFADSKKTAARSAAGFSPTLSPIFLATFVKVSILGHARSGHQVRSSDHTLQKIYNRAPATVFEGKLWNFRNMIRS